VFYNQLLNSWLQKMQNAGILWQTSYDMSNMHLSVLCIAEYADIAI